MNIAERGNPPGGGGNLERNLKCIVGYAVALFVVCVLLLHGAAYLSQEHKVDTELQPRFC